MARRGVPAVEPDAGEPGDQAATGATSGLGSGSGPAEPDRAADRIRALRRGRRLALSALYEAEFGQRTVASILDRLLAGEADPRTVHLARSIVDAVHRHRVEIDARIEALAPQFPVVTLAPIDRAILRGAVGEVLHSGTTPARVAIAEWVELARTFSGDPLRRLLNGVLGRIADEVVADPSSPAVRPDEPTSNRP